VGTAGWEGRGVGMWQAGTCKVVASSVSIKDRLVGPLRASIKYTDRMPVIWAR
jgi:hypothetical protein